MRNFVVLALLTLVLATSAAAARPDGPNRSFKVPVLSVAGDGVGD